jgi:putative transposase
MSTSPYSSDLRKKVIEYLNKGKSKKQASEVFGVHRNTISRWSLRYCIEGSYSARTRLGYKSKLNYKEIESFVVNNQDTKLSDIGSKFLISIGHAGRILKKLGFSYKKSLHLFGSKRRKAR